MIINRAYKIEINPNNKQRNTLEKSVGCARFAYNWGLKERINLYEKENKSLFLYDQYKVLCSKKKAEFSWMYDVSKCVPQEALRDLDSAFKNFFRGTKKGQKVGFPKFKSKHKDKDSFRISFGFYITNKTINIPKVGYVKFKEKNYIPIKDIHINSMTVSKEAGRWYISVQVEQDIPESIAQLESVLGVDVGLKTLATCSDSQVFDNPKYLNKTKKKLAHTQKNLARKMFDRETKRSSNNRNKAKLRVQRVYQRISNQRKDAIHKMTSILAKTKPRYIVLEDLNVSGMMKNHKLAGAIGDASFNEIKRQLIYKTAWYGGSLIEANRFFPSSKMCCRCGAIKEELTLKDRIYVCGCGNEMDRDLNASINLENYGVAILQSTAGLAGIKARGESVRLQDAFTDQEAVSGKREENLNFYKDSISFS